MLPAPALAQRADAPYTGNLIPQGSPLPRVLPSGPPAVAGAPVIAPPAPPSASPLAMVSVRDVVLVGATAFPETRTGPIVAGLTGPAVPVRRIEAARNALVLLYRRHGFLLTTVNARLDAQHVLRFVVVEGHIVDVKLDGNIGPAGVQVLRFLRHLTEEPVLDNATLERWLLLAQDVPGVTVHAVLKPSADDPGALTLIAQVSRQAVNGLFAADNRATRLTGPQEGLLVFDLNSFTQFGERTEASIYHTSGNTQNFGQISEDVFTGASGLHVRIYGGYGKATPSDFLRAIDYEGFTDTFGVSAIYPLIRSRAQTLNLLADFDLIETEIRAAQGPDGEVARASRDSLRVGRWAADYALEDTLAGAARPATNTAEVRVSQGLPFLGGTSNANPLPSRTGEDVGFTSVSAALTRNQGLFSPWDGANLALRGRLLGQYSADVLPASEEFFLGGTDIDRGYYSGQASGDSALAETVELDLDTAYDRTLFGRALNIGAEYYAFYDRGQTYQNRKADPDVLLTSEGIGARFSLTRYLEIDVEGDIRNTRLPFGTAGNVKPLKADIAYWRALARF